MDESKLHLKLHNLVDTPRGFDLIATITGIATDYIAYSLNNPLIQEQIRQEWINFLANQLTTALKKYQHIIDESTSLGWYSNRIEHQITRQKENTEPYRLAIARIYTLAQLLEMDKEVDLAIGDLLRVIQSFKLENEHLLHSTRNFIVSNLSYRIDGYAKPDQEAILKWIESIS